MSIRLRAEPDAQPATYTPARAADTGGRMFGTAIDFVFASRMDGDI